MAFACGRLHPGKDVPPFIVSIDAGLARIMHAACKLDGADVGWFAKRVFPLFPAWTTELVLAVCGGSVIVLPT